MVFLSLEDNFPLSGNEVANKLKTLDVLVGVVSEKRFRLVTHYGIEDADIDSAIGAFQEVVGGV